MHSNLKCYGEFWVSGPLVDVVLGRASAESVRLCTRSTVPEGLRNTALDIELTKQFLGTECSEQSAGQVKTVAGGRWKHLNISYTIVVC
jgi:hypothetical protein